MELTYLARQPIFDRRLEVIGYELLYRAGPVGPANIPGDDEATMHVAEGVLNEFGLDALVGRGKAFINVTASFLEHGLYRAFPRDQVVLELVERAVVNEGLTEAVAQVRADGYSLALDDFAGQAEAWPLVDHARIVKVDLLDVGRDDLIGHTAALRAAGVTMLAEKVETYDELERCKALGFDLFQGFFFERPEVLSRTRLSPDRLAATQLLAELLRPDAEVEDVAEVIRRDVALTYRVLSVVNSALYGLSRRVESVPQAIVLLGLDMIRNFASLIALSQVGGKPSELVTTAMVRARMCERLALGSGRDLAAAAFLVGLLSVLEGLMDAPMAEVVARLPLTEPVEAALVGRRGRLGEILDVVEAYEREDLGALEASAWELPSLTPAYLEAVEWVREVRTTIA